MFRILIVDDDRLGAGLLRTELEKLPLVSELHFVEDGVEALDFLHRRGMHRNATRPHLILLDVNMPRLGGLETVAAIKSDPELHVIPVVMLSSSTSPEDVRNSYRARANCYVLKPTDVGRSSKLAQFLETFWMDSALLPAIDSIRLEESAPPSKIGPSIAIAAGEENKPAMQKQPGKRESVSATHQSRCEENERLLKEFGDAVRELLTLHEQQFLAIVEADSECTRFDLLIHMANEKKQHAKYAYLRHVESHGCSNQDAAKQTRT